jgi:hypothetical protein
MSKMKQSPQLNLFSHISRKLLVKRRSKIIILLSALALLSFNTNTFLSAQEVPELTFLYSAKLDEKLQKEKERNRAGFVETNKTDELEKKQESRTPNKEEQNTVRTSSADTPLIFVEQEKTPRLEKSNGQISPSVEEEIDVLIDIRHAHDFSDFPLTTEDRNYHRIYSFHSAFAYLKSQGVKVEKSDSDIPLDEETLAKCKALFLNLPSGDKAPFLLKELVAIRNFINAGGSAFFIVEHTNCYFHQSRLTPLFHELGIEPQFYSICDATKNLGTGYGWIYLDKFTPSPITHNLRQIAFQTGGGVDPRNAVVWSSEQSWQDAADIPMYGEADISYFGNFLPEKNERVGSSGAVLAKEVGQGRVVVVGDQNIFSTFFLQYLDNYRLWNNSFAWLLDRPELADPQKYIASVKDSKLILCWEELRPNAKRFGSPDANGYYNIYAVLCRYYRPFCIANDDSEIGLVSKILIWIDADENESQEAVDFAYKQLKSGKTLLVLDPSKDVFKKEKSPLLTIIRKLKENGVENDAPTTLFSLDENDKKGLDGIEEINFSNGGKLVTLKGKDSFNNSEIPAPEAKLLLRQQENLKTLLKIIDTELNR